MITVLTGAPGHGKSYTSIKMIAGFVHEGKPVGTNVPLAPDFAIQMARHYTGAWRLRPEKVRKRAEYIESMIHYSDDLGELMRVRFDGDREGRGKIVIDEAHRTMNVRGSIRGKSPEAEARKKIVGWASAHRHYGADLVLITQALTNMDTQVRNLLEFHSEVRNLRKLPILGWLIRFLPGGQLFIRVTWWNDRAKTKAGVAAYGLSKRLARLYDTHGLAITDAESEPIMLPSHPEDRPILKHCDAEADAVESEAPALAMIGAPNNGNGHQHIDPDQTAPSPNGA